MHTSVSAFIDDTFEQQIASLQEQIRIPSVKSDPREGMPFGESVASSLDHALHLARQLGLSARSLDGYIGIVDYGTGDETLGVLCHLDVVPVGAGWHYPPFGAEIHDGRIYGRGAIDDKGPAISALYALAAIKHSGLPLKRRIRLLLGCDEEHGWGCIEHYKQHEPMPDFAFSPDAQYPLVNSEKGIVHAFFEQQFPCASSIRITCGSRANVIPGEANAVVPLPLELVEQHLNAYVPPKADTRSIPGNIYAQAHPEGTLITATGVGGHASTPEISKNALQMLICFLSTLPLPQDDQARIGFFAQTFSLDYYGQQLGLDVSDASGRLTLNLAILNWTQTGLSLGIDVRYPISFQSDWVLEQLKSILCKNGLQLKSTDIQPAHFVSPDEELVQKLLHVYRTYTGDKHAQPLSIGGGTYARAMERAVAFGCERPGDIPLAHMPDESISLDDMRFNTHLIAGAMLALAGDQV